jgi:hypothetical protein
MATPNGNIDIVTGKNSDDEHIFSVIVKRTYNIKHGKPLERNEEDAELRKTDTYYDDGDPEWSVVQYEYDLAPHKLFADVVVVGKAYAPEGKTAQAITVGARVGKRKKLVRVFGDRQCIYRADADPEFTDPEMFSEMEIRYDRAYGGYDEKSDASQPFYYPRNTQGCGVVMQNVKESIDGLVLPNVEDPEQLISPESLVIGDPKRWPEQPLPQGLGWFQRNWYPRCALMGAFPAYVDVGYASPEEVKGMLPKNHIALAMQYKLPSYVSRFNNGASLGMTFRELPPNEKIELRGLNPSGKLDFTLPGETPQVSLDIGKGETELDAKLDTVCIRPDDLQVDMLWRATLVYEGYSWFPSMTRLHAEVS